jgi:mannose-6-phosphate isomerase class I
MPQIDGRPDTACAGRGAETAGATTRKWIFTEQHQKESMKAAGLNSAMDAFRPTADYRTPRMEPLTLF